MTIRISLWLGCLAMVLAGAAPCCGQVTFSGLLSEMTNRDSLSYFPTYTTYAASSYDRSENVGPSTTNWAAWYGNADYSNYYGTYNGQSIMLSASGAGALTHLWTASYAWNGNINVYIDGSTTPISILSGAADTVIGGNSVFGSPLSAQNPDYASCPANNLYAPIPYQNGIIVTYSGSNPQWYNLQYQQYPAGTQVTSFTSATPTSGTNATALANANQCLSNPAAAPAVAANQTQTRSGSLASGQYIEDLFTGGSGAVRQLQVTLSAANMSAALQNTYLQISCDNQQTVYVPVGMFFGTGPQQVNNTSDYYTTVNLTSGGTAGSMTSYWTMPYQNASDIRLVNLGSQAVTATLSANSGAYTWTSQSMYFHADFRAENNITAGGYNNGAWNGGQNQDWNYVRIQGPGLYVGDTLAVTNTSGVAGQWWGEGDDEVWVDSSPASGAPSGSQGLPRILGTGTEDAYCCANGLSTVYSGPFSNAAQTNAYPGLGTTVVTRVRSQDAIPFNSYLQRDQEIQSWVNEPLNLQAASFWYGAPGTYAWQTIANVSDGVNAAITGGTCSDAGTWQFLGSKSVLVNTSSGQGTAWNFLSAMTVGNSGNTGLGSSGNGGYNFPAVGNAPILATGTFVRNDDVSMYPGGTYNGANSAYAYAVDRWVDTSTSGTIDINGSIRNLQTNSSGVNFYVLVNGVVKYSVSGAGAELPQEFFDVQTTVQAGSTVDFVLGASNSGALTGDESDLDATISVPEGIGTGMGVPTLNAYNSIAGGNWGSTSTWDAAAVPGTLGVVQVNANLVTVNSAATAWSCAVAGGGTLALAAGQTLSVGGTMAVSPGGLLSFAAGSTLNAGGGTLDKVLAAGSFAIDTAGTMSINSYFGSGVLTFTKQGGGDLTLAPFTANTAAGTSFLVTAGRLLVSGSNPLGGATSVTLQDGVLNVQGGATPGAPGTPGLAGVLLTFGGSGSAAPVLESSGTLSAAIGTAAGDVQWTGNGGFSAQGGPLAIRLNGGTGTIAWGSANFVPSGSDLVLGSATSDNAVDFQNGINLSGGNRTIVAMENPLATSALAMISGAISGSGGLTAAGSGTLALSGSDTYSGATLVAAGVLDVTAAGALTATGTINTYSGGALTIAGSVTVAPNGAFAVGTSFAGTGTVNVNSGAVLNIGGGSGGYAGRTYIGGKLDNVGSSGDGVLNVNGGIVHVAAGSSALSGDANALWMNAYAGAGSTLNLNGGTLSTAREIENGSSYPATINFNGGTLQAAANLSTMIGSNNSTAITANINAGGAVIDTQDYNVTMNQVLSHGQGGAPSGSDGGLTKTGGGTLILGGANTYTGVTTINAGILQANNASALGNGGNITFAGGKLQYTASSAGQDWSALFKNSTAPITLDTNSQTVTFNQAIDSSNTAGLSKIGAGTLVLSSSQNYSGPTLISGGTLQFQSTGIDYVGTQFDMGGAGGSGSASHWRQSSTPKTYALENNAIYGTDGYDVVGANSRVLVPSYVSGFTITSSIYPGNSSYATIDDPNNPSNSIISGTTNPGSADVFTFTTTGSNIPGDIRLGMMIDGLDIAGYNPYSLQVKELNGAELSSPVVATTSSEYDDRQPDWVFFDIKGAQAGNQYTVYAQQGANGTATVQVFTFDSSSSAVANNFLPSATTLTVAAGSTLDLGGVSQRVAFLSNSSPGSGGGLINSNTAVAVVLTLSPSGGSSTFSGTIGGGGGTLSLAMSGSGTQVLAGVNSYTGGTAIEAGVLSLANSAALGPSGAISFGGGTLQFSAGNTRDYASRIKNSSDSISLDTNGQTVTFDGNIDNSNTGGLTKLGYGELVLSGSNGFAGGMVVTDGTLVLADNEALADGSSLTIGDASAFTGGQGAAGSDTGTVSSGLVEGVPVPSITPVPEPGTLVLLLSIVFSVRFSVFSKRLVFTEH